MQNTRQPQLQEIFEAAAECAPPQRPALLTQLCADDKALRAEVEALLALLPQAADFIEEPPALAAALLNDAQQTLAPGRRIGPYEVLSELGRGGMGVVYLAVRADDVYRKQVAIKLVWPGYDSSEIARRFQQERQILAHLDHPNITRVLDGGATAEGWPYVVMEYVDGQPLPQYCNARRLAVNERLALFQQVCAAVEYAHRHLIIHRDLKPSNILVTAAGQAKLLDFGIAKILDPALRSDALSLTHTGLHALTPEYASPEQVRGAEITTASDVYSLGVVLYELLTGQQPYRFPSRALHEVLRVIAEAEPVRPSLAEEGMKDEGGGMKQGSRKFFSSLIPHPSSLKGDLDKIILKALRKEPEQRYRSVEQFSADIARHLAGEPVLARQPTITYRAGKFMRRHPTGVAVTITLLLALLAALAYLSYEARQQRRVAYAARVRQASVEWFDGNPRGYDELLQTPPVLPQAGEEDLRGLEWRYLWRLGHREQLSFAQTDFGDFPAGEPGGLLLTRHDNAARIVLREAQSGRPIVERTIPAATLFQSYAGLAERPAILFSRDGHTLLSLDLLSSAQQMLLQETSSPLTCYWHNAARQFLTGHADGQVKLWPQQAGQPGTTIFTAAGSLRLLYQTQDRAHLVTLTTEKIVQVWEAASGRQLLRLDGANAVVANPHMKNWLAVQFNNRTIGLYDLHSGRKLTALDTSPNPILFATSNADGTLLVSDQDNIVRLYELPTLRLRGSFVGHSGWVNAAVISTNGRWLATASSDRTIKLWETATQRTVATLRGHQDDVVQVSWSGRDRQLASLSRDHTLKVWDVADVLHPDVLTGHTGHVYAVAFSPTGRLLASAGKDSTIKLWDAATGALLNTLRGHQGQVLCVNFSPDGQRLVSSGEDHTARVWDAATGALQFELCCHKEQQHYAAFAPDGKFIATASDDSTLKLWDAASGCEIRTLTVPADKNGHVQNIWSLAFTPDSRGLATGTDKGEVRLWDVASGRLRAAFQAHDSSVWSIAFTPDGQQFATASGDNTARLWRTDTQHLIRAFKGHADGLFELAFSPDGQRLVTASRDKTVRFWNVVTGQELLLLKGHPAPVWTIAFAPDGQTLASAGEDGAIRLWRAAQPTLFSGARDNIECPPGRKCHDQ